MVVKACDCRCSVKVEFLGNAVQIGQPDVNTAHRYHAGFKQVDVTVFVTRDLRRTDNRRSC